MLSKRFAGYRYSYVTWLTAWRETRKRRQSSRLKKWGPWRFGDIYVWLFGRWWVKAIKKICVKRKQGEEMPLSFDFSRIKLIPRHA